MTKPPRFWHLSPPLVAILLALGAFHALSFAPGPLPPWALPFVQIFSLAFLAHHTFRSSSGWQAALKVYLFGISNFAVGLYWLFISMHEYGGLAAPLAGFAVLLLAAAMAIYSALAVSLAWWLSEGHRHAVSSHRGQLMMAVIWASSWTLFEWLRGTLFTGLPWLNLGYAHVEGLLAGWAPVIGVYGLTWLAAFAAAAIGLFANANAKDKDQGNENSAKSAMGVGLAVVAGLVGIVLSHATWWQPHGNPIIVRLVQGNTPQSMKFNPQFLQQSQKDYLQLATLAPREPDGAPDLIVLPETVIPLLQDRIAPELWQQWQNVARERNATIIMGVPLHDQVNGRDRYTNSAIAFNADTPIDAIMSAQVADRYDKHHLVPFGEFIPTGFQWFVDAMNIPLGDFDRGQVRQTLFTTDGQTIAPDICFEDVFGEEIIQSVKPSADHGSGATILLNMSNLGWFGDSWALRQHLQISRMRALETARPMLRSTNTGMTAAIDPNGKVRAVLEPMSKGVLDVEVQGASGLTPYVRWGNTLILGWALFWLGAASARRRPQKPSPTR
ncbi:apolipoprotein N-acyltransferase [Pusillimonas sp. ANT_WB101]|uniref:apolipoprotein N-acyltransferase n=1 Tax=Pusillimonas sp. ANT_WB101 TaxID=2597356 RepID=UPI0021050E77|nr:apolipoprotein N-acyltransferase [Pusillimonas sp. ANT_WB101]